MPSLPNAKLRRLAAATLTLALFTMTQCVCQNRQGDNGTSDKNTSATTKPTADNANGSGAVDLPKIIDASSLEPAEKALLGEILAEQFDPCGSPKSLMDALKQSAPCDRAFAFAKKLVQWIGVDGLSKRQAVQKYLTELARTSTKAEFSYEGSPAFGDPASKIQIVKFTDFQCPYCKISSQPVKDLAKKYNAVLYLKHMPLSHHQHATEAAKMATAAHQQGKFWDVYKAFFANQEALDSKLLRELVVKAGLDMVRFDKDLASPAIAALLKRDRDEADAAEVDGTPTIYVNGFKVEFDNLEDKLKELQR